MLVRPPLCEYRTWIIDSRRWSRYRPRAGDVVVATYPKCGTTWMQRIVNLLIFQSTEPMPVSKLSPWLDRRFPVSLDDVIASLEAQTHRRAIKSHLPFDGLPLYDEVFYIHVARDGRDACMSFHNHATGFRLEVLEALDREGLADETIARPYPRPAADPAVQFRRWLTEGVIPSHDDGTPTFSFFQFVRSYWQERRRSNLLLVHYNDLAADLEREMRRVADFLRISVAPALWPHLVDAARFDAMKRDGDKLMPEVVSMFGKGSATFFYKASNGRWRDILTPADLAAYQAKTEVQFTPACASWTAAGRGKGEEPRLLDD